MKVSYHLQDAVDAGYEYAYDCIRRYWPQAIGCCYYDDEELDIVTAHHRVRGCESLLVYPSEDAFLAHSLFKQAQPHIRFTLHDNTLTAEAVGDDGVVAIAWLQQQPLWR